MMCKNIVDMHGGRLNVHYEGEGHGSVFRLQVPMIRHVETRLNETVTSTLETPMKDQEFHSVFSVSITDESKCMDDEVMSLFTPTSTPMAFRHRLDSAYQFAINPKRLFSTMKDAVTIDSPSVGTNASSHPFIAPTINKKRFLLVDDDIAKC